MSTTNVSEADSGQSSADLRQVARNGSLAGIGGIAAAFGGFALTLIVARGLGPGGSGVFFECVAVFTILAALCTFGADTGALRSVSRLRALGRRHDVGRTLMLALVPVGILSMLAATIVAFTADSIVQFVVHGESRAEAAHFLRLMMPFLAVATVCTVASQASRGFGPVMPYVTVQNIFLPMGRAAAILVAVLVGSSLTAVSLAWAGVLLPALALGLIYLRRDYTQYRNRVAHREAPPRRTLAALFREFWSYASVRGLAATVDVTLVWFDVLLVGVLRSTAEAGIYATASRFVVTGTIVLQATRIAIAPQISAFLSTDQVDRASVIYRTATTWIITSSWPVYVVLATFGGTILRLFGQGFEVGGTALAILAVGMLANLGTGNVGTVLLMSGRSGVVFANKVVAVATNVALNLLLVPDHGIVGAAIAWFAAIVVDNGLSALEVRHLLGLRGYDRSSLLAAVGSLALVGIPCLVARQLLGDELRGLAAGVLIGGVLYVVFVWLKRESLGLPHARSMLGSRLGSSQARTADKEPIS